MATRSARTTDATSLLKNLDRVFTGLNTKLEKPIREHLTAVYSNLCIGLTAAFVGACAHFVTDFFRAGFLCSIVSFGLMMAIIATPPVRENEKKRFGYFLGFSFATGISLGPLLEFAIAVDPTIISTAFFASVIIFGAFSLASLWAEDTKFLFLGGTLTSATFTLLFASLFARWLFPVWILLALGLAISCGFILYDTQLIVEKRRMGDDDYVWHSVELFIDFIQVFRYLVVILSDKKNNERRKD